MKIKKRENLIFGIMIILLVLSVISYSSFVGAAADYSTPTVCCQVTNSGEKCQNVPQEECSTANSPPTSCESTTFCKPAFCYNSFDGSCTPGTSKFVCESEGGLWAETMPPQCELGCCVLGDQASLTTLVKCKKLSASFGLETNYKKNIKDAITCFESVAGQEKGACVYEEDFETTCQFSTRDVCKNTIKGDFYKNKLCSADELATNCGPTTQKTTSLGRDEVFFEDTCGNAANIYDSSKTNSPAYWSNVVSKLDSCNPDSNNAGSSSCGNCNYLLGSTARDNGNGLMCVDLNCKGSSEQLGGKTTRNHGESWCAYQDEGSTGYGSGSAGSRFLKLTCSNGEIIPEACADFRQEECIQDEVPVGNGKTFMQAACRVNRWRDCAIQGTQEHCEDETQRDCIWDNSNGLNAGTGSIVGNYTSSGTCLAKNPPGFEFWKPEGEADEVCVQATATCTVVYQKSLLGGLKCKENCHCLTPEWEEERAMICSSLGDCGAKENFIGEQSKERGYSRFVDAWESYTETLREILSAIIPSGRR